MTTWRWYLPPWLRGLGEWRACVSRDGYAVYRFTRTGWVCRCSFGVWPTVELVGQVAHLQLVTEAMMKRRVKSGEGVVKSPHADATELLETHPTLAAWLTDPTFEDGADRPAGWIGLSAEGGLFSALLKDAGERCQMRIQAPTLSKLFEMVEHSLCDPMAPWRHDSGAFTARQNPKKK